MDLGKSANTHYIEAPSQQVPSHSMLEVYVQTSKPYNKKAKQPFMLLKTLRQLMFNA